MRKLLIGLIVLALVFSVVGLVATKTTFGQDALLSQGLNQGFKPPAPVPEGLRVVVCGSASPLGNVPDRAQACIAVLTPKHFLIFDTGARSPVRMAQAGLPMGRLDGVFFTHFHSDHIAALPDVNLASWVRGRKQSLSVFGPRGIDRVISGFNTAYAFDFAYRTEHHGEDMLPAVAGPMTPRTIVPGQVAWEQDGLKVASFLVNHSPVEPAVGYRVDYRGRSVVISGDTVATDSLFANAQDADLLLHDALSRALLDPMIAKAKELDREVGAQIMTDVIEYHADSLNIEDRAKDAGVKRLAYYHLVPAPPNSIAEAIFRRGLSAETIIVKDLQIFDLPPDSTEILITDP